MVDVVRIGLVGCGFMGKAHSLSYRNLEAVHWPKLPRIELTRVADAIESVAREGAERYGWQSAVDDWRSVTRGTDIDLVDIVTPNDLHAEAAIDAAEHGKFVLCEKPLANSLEAAQRMYDAVAKAGVGNQVNFVFRKWPAVVLAKRLIDDGHIGAVTRFRGWYFVEDALDANQPVGWRFDKTRAGSGSIGDIGSHVIDLARYLAGDLSAVLARLETVVPVRPVRGSSKVLRVAVDDAADILLRFASGASGSIQTGWAAAGHRNDIGFEVAGDEGAIRFGWERANELEWYRAGAQDGLSGFQTIVVGPDHPGGDLLWPAAGLGLGYGDAFLISLGDAVNAAAGSAVSAPSFLDGLRVCEVTDAALRSADTGTWISLPARSHTGA